ncbi:hypothetical protein SNEBB_009348 [Seison nebaliae]|nr:hypothetical protein SNEBB_009348 [Seison nebaliae]
MFRDNISYENGRYNTKLPWKTPRLHLESNFGQAKGRLDATLRKLRKNAALLECYNDIIKDQLKRGFIEELDNDFIKGHYLPHQYVTKDSATTPIRIVFDASAKGRNGISLNDCLHSGPVLTNELLSVLIRFRLDEYVAIADISKAYHQVGLHEEDRDFTRFLWPADPRNPHSRVKAYRFRVVLFGATCSSFLLQATIQEHLKKFDSEQVKNLARDIYVDNVHLTAHNETDLHNHYKSTSEIFYSAHLPLREWISNSEYLNNEFNSNNVVMKEHKPKVKFLGMKWKTSTDELSFSDVSYSVDVISKRTVVSDAAKLYDPLGILLPMTIRSRIFIQDLWQAGYDWDSPLSHDHASRWRAYLKDIARVTTVAFPRVSCISSKPVQLHIFSDASGSAYGAAAYLVQDNDCRLLMAKARVAPLKAKTIPKMELTAALIAARLSDSIKESLIGKVKIDAVHCWVDSMVVLAWLRKQDRSSLTAFVRNRVDEISTHDICFHYVPTAENPSDLISRGVSLRSFRNKAVWFRGPAWLTDPAAWPQAVSAHSCEEESEINSEVVNVNATLLRGDLLLSSSIDLERYSSLRKVIRVTAWMNRFVKNSQTAKPDRCLASTLSAIELSNAETSWIRTVQAEACTDILEFLQGQSRKPPDIVKQLRLFMDNSGVIRCRSRLQLSDMEQSSKCPIYLPRLHRFTKLKVVQAHEDHSHAGVTSTVALLRSQFWIPRCRQLVRSVVKQCRMCCRLLAMPYKAPDVPPLPSFRVQRSRAFSHVGIDYAGPFLVKGVGTPNFKAYIVLYTCASTRAVHLEVVEDASTEAFLRSFRCFCARRSTPKLVLTDNASTFLNASLQLKALYKEATVQEAIAQRGITWRTIPARAPWFGGFWERMVGLTKDCMRKTLGRAFVTFAEFRAICTEIEARINSRPITCVSPDIDDPEPLTPAHLIMGEPIDVLPALGQGTRLLDPSYDKEAISSRHRRYQQKIDDCWRRWRDEYLTSLREQQSSSNEPSPIKVGDVVLIHQDTARLNWKLGRVVGLHMGRDGRIRSAEVKTDNGVISRPVVKLYPLETSFDPGSDPAPAKDLPSVNEMRPPRRKAAIKARRKFVNNL